MKVLKLIKERRSVRKFKDKKVSKKVINGILEAGRWAPSGLNNQPWRFLVLKNKEKNALAEHTKYSSILRSADVALLIFMDKDSSYNKEKDLMAIGACIQNMLLYIHAEGLGACWLGEILNQRKQAQKDFKFPLNCELQGVLAIGEAVKPLKTSQPKRKALEELMLG